MSFHDQRKIQVFKASEITETRLSTGSPKLDSLLHGGLPNEGVIEISGASGCGKSQLCMQLSLTVQYPLSQGGLGGGAIYICTEERFQSRRLYQLIQNFPKRYYKQENNDINFGDNILIMHASNFDNLISSLKRAHGPIIRKNIKLIVIDSIAGIIRGNYNSYKSQLKVTHLRMVANYLYRLSSHYRLLVICTNQVAQSIKIGRTIPALGLAWANLITARLFVFRREDTRYLYVSFSPELKSKYAVQFSIEDAGIHTC